MFEPVTNISPPHTTTNNRHSKLLCRKDWHNTYRCSGKKIGIRPPSNDDNDVDEPGEEVVKPRQEHVIDRWNHTEQEAVTENEAQPTEDMG